MESFEIKKEKIFQRSPICEIKCPNCQNKLSLAVKPENRVICLFSSKKSAQCKSPSSRKTSTKLIRNASVLLLPKTPSFYLCFLKEAFYLFANLKLELDQLFENRAETSLTHFEWKINLLNLRVLVIFARISIPRKSLNQKYGF